MDLIEVADDAGITVLLDIDGQNSVHGRIGRDDLPLNKFVYVRPYALLGIKVRHMQENKSGIDRFFVPVLSYMDIMVNKACWMPRGVYNWLSPQHAKVKRGPVEVKIRHASRVILHPYGGEDWICLPRQEVTNMSIRNRNRSHPAGFSGGQRGDLG